MGVSLGGVKYVLCQIQSPLALHENTGGDVVHFKDDKIKYYRHSAKLLLIGVVSYIGLYLIVRNITVPNLLYWFIGI